MDLKSTAEKICTKKSDALKYRVRVLVRAEDSEKYLAVKRAKYKSSGKHWGLPGGKVDPNERLVDAAARECIEEIDYYPTHLIPLDIQKDKVRGKITVTFLAVAKHEFKPKLDKEHTSYSWSSLEKWPEPARPSVKRMFEDANFRRKLGDASGNRKALRGHEHYMKTQDLVAK